MLYYPSPYLSVYYRPERPRGRLALPGNLNRNRSVVRIRALRLGKSPGAHLVEKFIIKETPTSHRFNLAGHSSSFINKEISGGDFEGSVVRDSCANRGCEKSRVPDISLDQFQKNPNPLKSDTDNEEQNNLKREDDDSAKDSRPKTTKNKSNSDVFLLKSKENEDPKESEIKQEAEENEEDSTNIHDSLDSPEIPDKGSGLEQKKLGDQTEETESISDFPINPKKVSETISNHQISEKPNEQPDSEKVAPNNPEKVLPKSKEKQTKKLAKTSKEVINLDKTLDKSDNAEEKVTVTPKPLEKVKKLAKLEKKEDLTKTSKEISNLDKTFDKPKESDKLSQEKTKKVGSDKLEDLNKTSKESINSEKTLDTSVSKKTERKLNSPPKVSDLLKPSEKLTKDEKKADNLNSSEVQVKATDAVELDEKVGNLAKLENLTKNKTLDKPKAVEKANNFIKPEKLDSKESTNLDKNKPKVSDKTEEKEVNSAKFPKKVEDSSKQPLRSDQSKTSKEPEKLDSKESTNLDKNKPKVSDKTEEKEVNSAKFPKKVEDSSKQPLRSDQTKTSKEIINFDKTLDNPKGLIKAEEKASTVKPQEKVKTSVAPEKLEKTSKELINSDKNVTKPKVSDETAKDSSKLSEKLKEKPASDQTKTTKGSDKTQVTDTFSEKLNDSAKTEKSPKDLKKTSKELINSEKTLGLGRTEEQVNDAAKSSEKLTKDQKKTSKEVINVNKTFEKSKTTENNAEKLPEKEINQAKPEVRTKDLKKLSKEAEGKEAELPGKESESLKPEKITNDLTKISKEVINLDKTLEKPKKPAKTPKKAEKKPKDLTKTSKEVINLSKTLDTQKESGKTPEELGSKNKEVEKWLLNNESESQKEASKSNLVRYSTEEDLSQFKGYKLIDLDGRESYDLDPNNNFDDLDYDLEEVEYEEYDMETNEVVKKKKKVIVKKKGSKVKVTPLEAKPPKGEVKISIPGELTRQISKKRLSLVDEDLCCLVERRTSITDDVIVEESAYLDSMIRAEMKNRRKSSLGFPAIQEEGPKPPSPIKEEAGTPSPSSSVSQSSNTDRRAAWKTNAFKKSVKSLGKFFKPQVREEPSEDEEDEECDVNCHRKCQLLMPNLCGVNQKLMAEALSRLQLKGRTSQSEHHNANSSDCSESSAEANPGRVSPPAKTLPRFRTYTIDDFQFLKVLGKGSFGKVLLAELKGSECYYAVKCLKKDVVLEDDDVECTLIERKVLALATGHPYFSHLFCTFQTESHLFFVMEYLNGGDLMFHIQQSGRFDEGRARFYAAEIVSGLSFLHKWGIVYRDLKLDNVLLDFDGHVRIADFGMCKLQIYLDKTTDTFCGTPDYMAPEIIKGLNYNQSVDWWSFGILLYELLVGQSPFSGCDEDDLFWSICNSRPHIPSYLSAPAKSILLSLMEKDWTKRLGSSENGAADVMNHKFFDGLKWHLLERKMLEPPFKPTMKHPLDTKYFDKMFTSEKPVLTPVDKKILESMDQTQFQGFSYTNPNATE